MLLIAPTSLAVYVGFELPIHDGLLVISDHVYVGFVDPIHVGLLVISDQAYVGFEAPIQLGLPVTSFHVTDPLPPLPAAY